MVLNVTMALPPLRIAALQTMHLSVLSCGVLSENYPYSGHVWINLEVLKNQLGWVMWEKISNHNMFNAKIIFDYFLLDFIEICNFFLIVN